MSKRLTLYFYGAWQYNFEHIEAHSTWPRTLTDFFLFLGAVRIVDYIKAIIMAGWKWKAVIVTVLTVCALSVLIPRHFKCNLASVISQLVRPKFLFVFFFFCACQRVYVCLSVYFFVLEIDSVSHPFSDQRSHLQ